MLVILEGPDGAGKTSYKDTLIKKLKRLNHDQRIVTVHNGPYETPQLAEEAFSDQYDMAEAASPDTCVILDRCHISERIYSEVFREDKIADEEYWALDKKMISLGPQLILCLPPLQVSLQNWKESEDEMFRDLMKYLEVYEKYQNIRRFTKCIYRKFDYTRDLNKPMILKGY